MKKRLNRFFIALAVLLAACNDTIESDSEDGNWVKQSDFEGVTRSGAFSFTIGDFAYVGLGFDGDDYVTDFWRYDADRNFWEEMAEFPGEGRISAAAFSVDGKGYVGTGYNGDLEVEELQDFWEYDPDANTWTEIAPFGGGARYSSVAFTLNGRGYVGTGFDGNYLKDFWAYDPVTNEWTQTISLFGSKREGAVAFVVDGVAYVGSGRNNGQYLFDFWSFRPEEDTWVDLSLDSDDDDYDLFASALARYDAVSFVSEGKAYIATGLADAFLSSVYSYDPALNLWEDEYTLFEGVSRSDAVAFSINDVGYIATGRSVSLRHDDIWSFDPEAEYDEFD